MLSAVNDYFLYRLARAYFDRRSAKWALFCQLGSYFLFFVMVRPYSNSIETVCTTGALAYWPWKFLDVDASAKKKDDASATDPMKKSHRVLALSLAALGVLFRPTNVVIWIYPGLLHLVQTHDRTKLIFAQVLPIAVATLLAMLVIDRYGYGEWTFVPFNFFKFNVLEVRAVVVVALPRIGVPRLIDASLLVCVCRAKTNSTERKPGAGTSRRGSQRSSAQHFRSPWLDSSQFQYERYLLTASMFSAFPLACRIHLAHELAVTVLPYSGLEEGSRPYRHLGDVSLQQHFTQR